MFYVAAEWSVREPSSWDFEQRYENKHDKFIKLRLHFLCNRSLSSIYPLHTDWLFTTAVINRPFSTGGCAKAVKVNYAEFCYANPGNLLHAEQTSPVLINDSFYCISHPVIIWHTAIRTPRRACKRCWFACRLLRLCVNKTRDAGQSEVVLQRLKIC